MFRIEKTCFIETIGAEFIIDDSNDIRMYNRISTGKKNGENIIEFKRSYIRNEDFSFWGRDVNIFDIIAREKFFNKSDQFISKTDFFRYPYQRKRNQIVPYILMQFDDSCFFQIKRQQFRDGRKSPLLQALGASNETSEIFSGVYIDENYGKHETFIEEIGSLYFKTYELTTDFQISRTSYVRFLTTLFLCSTITRAAYVCARFHQNRDFKFSFDSRRGQYNVYYYKSEDFINLVKFISYYTIEEKDLQYSYEYDNFSTIDDGMVIIMRNPLYELSPAILRVPASFFIPTYKSVLCSFTVAVENFRKKEE